jgi:hypothetical protein
VKNVQNLLRFAFGPGVAREEPGKSGAVKKGQKPGASLIARLGEVTDMSKVHDYLTRDLVFGFSSSSSSSGLLPFTRYNYVKEAPGMGRRLPQGLGKYNKDADYGV